MGTDDDGELTAKTRRREDDGDGDGDGDDFDELPMDTDAHQ